jgi:hypothetical protein
MSDQMAVFGGETTIFTQRLAQVLRAMEKSRQLNDQSMEDPTAHATKNAMQCGIVGGWNQWRFTFLDSWFFAIALNG